MNVSRRWFIGGAASFGAFQGCRFIESPFGRNGVARLKIGIVSDIHVIAENTDRICQGNTRTFRHALRWFDAQGVDAVIIAGDMADAGLVSQLQCVADAWNAVFPGGRSALDGRKVERCFIYGNHDWDGYSYNYRVFGVSSRDLYPDHIQANGMKKTWEQVFEEEYRPVYRKEVKGYTFVGSHWDGANGSGRKGGADIAPFFAEHGKSIDPALPFFYFQHPHPKDTCYGAWAWGHDNGISTRVLSAYPNAIAFSGHSHYSLLDERGIWQGTFTSIGTGSLRYAGDPYSEFESVGGYENTRFGWAGMRKGSTPKLMEPVRAGDCRCGQLMSVYDDRIVLTRRDFVSGLDLGPDRVMPLPVAESKPFAFTEHAKRFPAPSFAAGAEIKVERDTRKIRDGETEREIGVFNLTVPLAQQTFANRVYRYELRVENGSGEVVLTRHVLAPDYHLPLAKAPAAFVVPVPEDDLPESGECCFSVAPVNCFGKVGAPLRTAMVSIHAGGE